MTTKAELVSAIAEKAGLNKNQAKDALEAFLGSVTDSLKAGQEVRLRVEDGHPGRLPRCHPSQTPQR